MYARAHANSDDFEYVYNVNNDFGAIVVVGTCNVLRSIIRTNNLIQCRYQKHGYYYITVTVLDHNVDGVIMICFVHYNIIIFHYAYYNTARSETLATDI